MVQTSVTSDRHKETGFTLIELLVVMAILGVLATLLLGAISIAKGYAKSVACKNHLRQMGMALQMYVHDDQNQYPRYLGSAGPSNGDASGKGGRATGLVYWSSRLFPYYPLNWTNSSFQCPGYGGKISGPDIPGSIDRFGSYAYNAMGVRSDDRTNEFFGLGPVKFWKDAEGNFVPPVFEAEVSVPSEMLAMGESLTLVGKVGGDDFWHASDLINPRYVLRHGKNYNQVLADGHVSAMKPSILFDPTQTAAMWNYDHKPHPELWPP